MSWLIPVTTHTFDFQPCLFWITRGNPAVSSESRCRKQVSEPQEKTQLLSPQLSQVGQVKEGYTRHYVKSHKAVRE